MTRIEAHRTIESILIAALALTGIVTVTALKRAVTYQVPTGQFVRNRGNALAFFGRPTDLAFSPDRHMLAVKQSHGIIFVDARQWKIVQTLLLPDLHVDFAQHLGGNGPAGILWSTDGNELWNTDEFGWLLGARRSAAGIFEWNDRIALPSRHGGYSAPIGIASSGDGATLFVALSRDNAIAAVDVAKRSILYKGATGNVPYGLVRIGGKLFVSNWAGRPPLRGQPSADSSGTPIRVTAATGAASSGTVSVIDLTSRHAVAQIDVGLHPSAIAASPDGEHLFVANSASETISVIDTQANAVSQTIALGHLPIGRIPTALTVSDNGNLWVAEGGANDLVAIDPSGRIRSRTATLWFPAGVAVVGRMLYVVDLKGLGSRALDLGLAAPAAIAALHGKKIGYSAYDYAGAIEAIPESSAPAPNDSVNQVSRARASLRGLFRHVLYIVAKNHTYDDYFGDLPQGNGDPVLCEFCDITPNHRALAKRFGLFDNFYVNSILSADGHNWTDEGYASDYVERSMGGWARSYPSAGNDALAYSPAGFIWNRVLEAGLSFRDYGEFIPDIDEFEPRGATWGDLYADYLRGTHRVRWVQRVEIGSLRPYVQRDYPSFSLRITDQYRASIFIRHLRRYEQQGRMPNLIVMALGNDHGSGNDGGRPTPRAYAADHDLALGRIVDAVTHSRFWRDSVIFVVEDDCQNGLDHVDGHRTMALVISPHNQAGRVYHNFYNQTSILRTIESIFGLAPLTEFDASAPLISQPFRAAVDPAPYDALPANMRLNTLYPIIKVVALRDHEHRDAVEH